MFWRLRNGKINFLLPLLDQKYVPTILIAAKEKKILAQ